MSSEMRANTSQRIEPNTIDSGTARVTLTTRVLYRIGVLLNTFIATIFYRIQVEGREHFPEHGGVLVIANHQSYYDPPIIGSMLNTRIFAFLARAGLFKIPGFGWLISRTQRQAAQRRRQRDTCDAGDAATARRWMADSRVSRGSTDKGRRDGGVPAWHSPAIEKSKLSYCARCY